MRVAAEGGGGRQLRSNDLGVDVDEEMNHVPRCQQGEEAKMFLVKDSLLGHVYQNEFSCISVSL